MGSWCRTYKIRTESWPWMTLTGLLFQIHESENRMWRLISKRWIHACHRTLNLISWPWPPRRLTPWVDNPSNNWASCLSLEVLLLRNRGVSTVDTSSISVHVYLYDIRYMTSNKYQNCWYIDMVSGQLYCCFLKDLKLKFCISVIILQKIYTWNVSTANQYLLCMHRYWVCLITSRLASNLTSNRSNHWDFDLRR